MKKFEPDTPRKMNKLLLAALIAASTSFGCQTAGEGDGAPARTSHGHDGAELFTNCQPCHGDTGLGRPELKAPAIAGLGAWYVKGQLEKFQTGLRGAHADDLPGLRMRPMSKTMRTPEDVEKVAEYVASLPAVKAGPSIAGGDPGRGAELYKACAACHGANGEGNEGLNAPSLNRADDWYLLTQLHNFKAGIRGTAVGDMTGGQMRAMANTLSDEQAMKDVVAYISKLK